MNKIKLNYRVESKTPMERELEIENYINTSILENRLKRFNNTDRKLISLSIRVSHRPNSFTLQKYAAIINNTNIDFADYKIKEIMDILRSRMLKRSIEVMDVVSIHIHMYFTD